MPKIKIADGIIRLGTDRGRRFGFVPELFDGYMWKAGDAVYISVILFKLGVVLLSIYRPPEIRITPEEIAALPPAFGGTTDVSGNLTTGTAQLYITDPDDAAGTAAIVTQQFNATWMLADGYNFAAGTVTVAKIIIESLEKVILTIDGTA